jgi:hypothetical protein
MVQWEINTIKSGSQTILANYRRLVRPADRVIPPITAAQTISERKSRSTWKLVVNSLMQKRPSAISPLLGRQWCNACQIRQGTLVHTSQDIRQANIWHGIIWPTSDMGLYDPHLTWDYLLYDRHLTWDYMTDIWHDKLDDQYLTQHQRKYICWQFQNRINLWDICCQPEHIYINIYL